MHVTHARRPQGRGRVRYLGDELGDRRVEYLLPVAQDDLLAGPAGGPHQLLRVGRKELGVEARVELLPDRREVRPAEAGGKRPHELGERGDIERLVDIDDATGPVPRGVHRRGEGAGGVADDHGRGQAGLLDRPVELAGNVLEFVRRLFGRLYAA
jgi:hypothetical protein